MYDYKNSTQKLPPLKKIKPNEIKVDDFIKTKFETIKGNFEEYISQVSEINGTEYNCRFIRKNIHMVFIVFLDEATVSFNEILRKITVIQERRGNYRFN